VANVDFHARGALAAGLDRGPVDEQLQQEAADADGAPVRDPIMTLPLAGRTIALAEGRQLEELAAMLEQEGAATLRCPLLSILDAPDPEPVHTWLRQLLADRFDYVVLFTGEGVRRLLGFADRAGWRDAVIAALSRTRTVTRGPKPVKALREVGLAPGVVAEKPTTEGVIATLQHEPLQEKTVGVQLYSETNPPLLDFLAGVGATVHCVLPYVYAPAADGQRVADLIGRMAGGTVDMLVLTSSPQVDRLYEVTAERGLEKELQAGLERTRVAAVGPVVAQALRQKGGRVDVCPEQGWVMRNLVRQIVRSYEASETPGGKDG
jgi:uroporphyrinogen-III synthase